MYQPASSTMLLSIDLNLYFVPEVVYGAVFMHKSWQRLERLNST